MKLSRGVRALIRLNARNQFMFCKKQENNNPQLEQKQNAFIKFIKEGWKQTFPSEEDEVRKRYQKVKQVKRYTEQELQKMQEDIPEYQRTAVVETAIPTEEKKSRFKVTNLIPETIKKKVAETSTYKQYSEFKQNLKQFVQTSDSVAVNLGTKAYNVVSQPSTGARATQMMRQYDKEFSLFNLQKQSTFIFRDAYQQFLQGNIQSLQMLCGEQALDLFKALLKINQTKQVKPKFTEILHHGQAQLKQTVMNETNLPQFLFSINIMEVYCMVDKEGKIVDGDEERVMESTYQFLLKYSGEYIGELGHPWQISEFRKVDEVKLLV